MKVGNVHLEILIQAGKVRLAILVAMIGLGLGLVTVAFGTINTSGAPQKPTNMKFTIRHSLVSDASGRTVARDDQYASDLVNSFPGTFDVVMQQCFGGGFVYDIQATGRPQTFASAAAWSDFAHNQEEFTDGTLSFLENFTRAWWQSENSGSGSNITNYATAIGQGRFSREMFAPPGYSNAGRLYIESPQYRSPDTVGPPGGPNDTRTRLASGLPFWAHQYAILVAWSVPEARHAANIARIYDALRTVDQIPAGNIVVLYGSSRAGTRLGPFTISGNGAATQTFPSPAAGGSVYVDGPNTRANWTNALAGRLFHNAIGIRGITYDARDRLFVYNTGHGGVGFEFRKGQQSGQQTRVVIPLGDGFNTTQPVNGVTNMTNPDGNDLLQVSTLASVDQSVQLMINGQPFGQLANYFITCSGVSGSNTVIHDISAFVSGQTCTYQIAVSHALLGTNPNSANVDFSNLQAPGVGQVAADQIAALDFTGGDQ